MRGKSRIIDLRIRPADALGDLLPADEPAEAPQEDTGEMADDMTDVAPSGRSGWLAPVLAGIAAAGWIGGALYWTRDSLTTLAPVALAEFVAALCVPLALITVLLLLVTRNSRAEARRFGNVAQAMRSEGALLEQRVAALAAALEENRARLAEQSHQLMALGDGAMAKLSAIGTGFNEQVGLAGDHAHQLAMIADGAQANLDTLLAMLPRAQSETAGLARLVTDAGVAASEHAAGLDAQLVALAERGREADMVAGGAAQRLAAHLTRMEATSEAASARLETVAGAMSASVDGLLDRTAHAVDEARKGIAAQGDAMLAMLGTNQAALERAGRDNAAALAERIGAIEAVIDRIAARLGEQGAASATMLHDLDTRIDHVAGRLDALHAQGIDRSTALADSLGALHGRADAMATALETGDAVALRTIDTAERLLTALDATTREIDETLPAALARLDARVAESRRIVGGTKPEMLALVTAAESTHDAVEAIPQVIGGQRETLDQLSATLSTTLSGGRDQAEALGAMVEETIGRTHRFAEEAAPRLVDALLRVRDTASAAAERARETLAAVIPDVAQTLEQESAEAMRRASASALDQQIAAIGEAAEAAADAAGRASERLTRQMLTIADTTAVIEHRIEEARGERERADTDQFSRRVSLLIESLNSASIDIAKAFSTEVSDSAWSAYLRGDRGVFTRRAVKLLDSGDAREIARLHEQDSEFREHVNRYIHDFEAMLRAILAQRDGSHLGVTLLSSDMGKLYVALAQAIERLRS